MNVNKLGSLDGCCLHSDTQHPLALINCNYSITKNVINIDNRFERYRFEFSKPYLILSYHIESYLIHIDSTIEIDKQQY